jgi:copper transport protein
MVAAGVGTFAVIWIEALGSHAASVQSHRAPAVAADALHVMAACLWLGALPALTVMLWPRATGAALVRACRGPFTRLIAASVGVVLVTGLYSAGRQVESVDDLFTTSYGQTLLIKSGLLAVLLGLGLVNASRLHGRHPWWLSGQRATAAPPLTRRLVGVEAGIGALLFVAVGVLVETAPARGQAPPQTAVGVETRSGSVADVVVTISATPNRPGLNGFTVIAASARRPAPAVVDGVQLEFTFGSKRSVLTLQKIEPEHYFGTAEVDEAGLVRIDAVVHRGGMRLTVPVLWQLSAPLQEQARSTPSHRLAPYLDGLAVLLIAAASVAGVSYGLNRRSARRRRLAAEAIPTQTEADRVLENSP